MFGSSLQIINIALALIISWGLFSIFCALVHEALVQLKSERGRFLKKELYEQLNDLANDVNWASLMYMNGSIDLLSKTPEAPPPTISPKLLAEVLIHEVAAYPFRPRKEDDGVGKSHATPLMNNFRVNLTNLQHSDIVSFLSQQLEKAEANSLTRFYDGGSSNFASDAYDVLSAGLEEWFGEFMDRVTLWYKKKTKQRLAALGILLAIAFNIDSIRLFAYYGKNPEATNTMISYYKDHAKVLDQLSTMTQSPTSKDSLQKVAEVFISKTDSVIKSAELPIGWTNHHLYQQTYRFTAYRWLNLLLMLLGFVLTGIAASMGAPFWFDLIKKAIPQK